MTHMKAFQIFLIARTTNKNAPEQLSRIHSTSLIVFFILLSSVPALLEITLQLQHQVRWKFELD